MTLGLVQWLATLNAILSCRPSSNVDLFAASLRGRGWTWGSRDLLNGLFHGVSSGRKPMHMLFDSNKK